MQRLESSTRGSQVGGYTTGKYYVDCDALPKHVDEVSVERYTKGEVAILKGVLRRFKHFESKHIVVKVSSNAAMTRKEYDISHKLQGIPGFIRFLCITSCNDDLKLYRHDQSSICHDTEASTPHYLLVMPYFSHGSFQNYAWQDQPINLFKSCLKQLILSLATAYIKHGFLHVDIHMNNVMIKPTKRTHILYEECERQVETNGMKIVVIDFERSLVGVHETEALFIDMLRIFNEIQTTMRLFFPLQETISTWLNQCINVGTPVVKYSIEHLLSLIDGIDRLTKKDVSQRYEYNPNVFGGSSRLGMTIRAE